MSMFWSLLTLLVCSFGDTARVRTTPGRAAKEPEKSSGVQTELTEGHEDVVEEEDEEEEETTLQEAVFGSLSEEAEATDQKAALGAVLQEEVDEAKSADQEAAPGILQAAVDEEEAAAQKAALAVSQAADEGEAIDQKAALEASKVADAWEAAYERTAALDVSQEADEGATDQKAALEVVLREIDHQEQEVHQAQDADQEAAREGLQARHARTSAAAVELAGSAGCSAVCSALQSCIPGRAGQEATCGLRLDILLPAAAVTLLLCVSLPVVGSWYQRRQEELAQDQITTFRITLKQAREDIDRCTQESSRLAQQRARELTEEVGGPR